MLIWTIPHNLNAHPEPRIVNNNNERIYGEVVYVDTNNITVTFVVPVSGIAYL
jgi:hypothetical protein